MAVTGLRPANNRMSENRMARITIFSFGYHGWGNATDQLVKSVDSVEKDRGFRTPLFVDTRINRSVRAKGFNGPAFQEHVGDHRYLWIKSLGNKRIQSGTGPKIQIVDPEAAKTLLDLAIERHEKDQRIIFYCSCGYPKRDGRIACHRFSIGTILVRAARQQGIALRVVEWPGGNPQRVYVNVDADVFNSVSSGRVTIPLRKRFRMAELAGLPHCSIATLRCKETRIHRLVSPAHMAGGEWNLPVLCAFSDPSASVLEYQSEGNRTRRQLGFDERCS